MNRRGFLGTILAACAAPAIVRADSLMRVVPRELVVDVPQGGIVIPPYTTMEIPNDYCWPPQRSDLLWGTRALYPDGESVLVIANLSAHSVHLLP